MGREELKNTLSKLLDDVELEKVKIIIDDYLDGGINTQSLYSKIMDILDGNDRLANKIFWEVFDYEEMRVAPV